MRYIASVFVLLAACTTDSKPSPGFVQTMCGPPPQEPGFSMQMGSDVNNPKVIIPEDQFNGLESWMMAEQDWVTCSLNL
jgi:hypothetical protein